MAPGSGSDTSVAPDILFCARHFAYCTKLS